MFAKVTLFSLSAMLGLFAAPMKVVAESQVLPSALATEFLSGSYDDGQGNTCTVGVSAASDGRTAGALSCKSDTVSNFNANWFTGPIAGHPFEPELVSAGIDKIIGAENVAWGQGSTNASTWYGCFNNGGDVISVHQAENVLAINNFGNDSRIDCTHSFVLVPP